LTPAKALARRLNEPDKLIAVLYYIWFHHAMRCEYQQSQRAIDELDAISRARNDSTAFVTARMTDSHTLGWMGKFQDAMNGFRVLREAYDVQQHGHLVHVYNHDLGATGVFAGHFLWALGYPEQAREAAFEQLGMARNMGHAFNLAWALTGGTMGLLMRREPDLARSWIAEGHAFARQHGISIIADVIAPIYDGYALIVQGQYDEGYTKAAPLAALWRSSGALHMVPFGYVMLAMGLVGLNRFGEAEELMKQTLQIIDQTGHRMDEAETHRMLGEVYRLQPRPNLAAAEASLYTAMRVARSQDAKGFELRAAMSLVRLWRDQNRGREASELLAPIYNWFTEGLDTKDLEEAKTLLEELS
jgi:predicted ATPase